MNPQRPIVSSEGPGALPPVFTTHWLQEHLWGDFPNRRSGPYSGLSQTQQQAASEWHLGPGLPPTQRGIGSVCFLVPTLRLGSHGATITLISWFPRAGREDGSPGAPSTGSPHGLLVPPARQLPRASSAGFFSEG